MVVAVGAVAVEVAVAVGFVSAEDVEPSVSPFAFVVVAGRVFFFAVLVGALLLSSAAVSAPLRFVPSTLGVAHATIAPTIPARRTQPP